MEKTPIYYELVGFRCLDSIQRQTNDLYLIQCGIHQCPLNHSWGPGTRSQHNMHFILDGCGYLEINNQKYHLSRGQIFLLPPDTVVHYYADNSNPWHYAWVGFDGTKAKQYMEQAGFNDKNLIRNTNIPPEKFSNLIYEMLEAHQLTITNELKQVGILFLLLSLLIESNNTGSNSKYNKYDYSSETYVEHALQYIQFNFNRNININDMAQHIGINRSYLFHIFKNKLQMSPKEYLVNFRMKKAKHLLCTTSDSIKEISKKVGYNDPLAFSKMFRHVVGDNPKHYRETNHE